MALEAEIAVMWPWVREHFMPRGAGGGEEENSRWWVLCTRIDCRRFRQLQRLDKLVQVIL